ncbi:MAG: hypothetical protein AAF518_23265 [Spirochaetota bacterium]
MTITVATFLLVSIEETLTSSSIIEVESFFVGEVHAKTKGIQTSHNKTIRILLAHFIHQEFVNEIPKK